MKFGLMYEHSTPRPFTAEGQRSVFENAIQQAKVGEQIGFDSVWCVEHHFLEEYSHSSCPDLFLAAVARETTTMRLGFGIATCVPGYHSAIRLAEKAAFLDHLSGGRVEFGTGRSSTWNELGGFGADIDATKESWDEYVRAIPQMWTKDRTAFDGKHVRMPERAVLPKPYQDPHPPMWVAVTAPGTEIEAAERGLGCLMLSMAEISKNVPRYKLYRETIAKCTKPVGSFVNDSITAVTWMYCHEDDAVALARGKELFDTFSYLAGQTVEVSEIFPSNAYTAFGLLAAIRADPTAPEEATKKSNSSFLFGSPARLRETVQEWQEAGVDRLIMMIQACEIIPQDEILKSMRLFSEEVIAHFPDMEIEVKLEEVA